MGCDIKNIKVKASNVVLFSLHKTHIHLRLHPVVLSTKGCGMRWRWNGQMICKNWSSSQRERERWRENDLINNDIFNELLMLIKVSAITDWDVFGLMLLWCQNIDLKVFIIIISKYACIKRGHMSCHRRFEGKQMHAGLAQSRYLKQTFVVWKRKWKKAANFTQPITMLSLFIMPRFLSLFLSPWGMFTSYLQFREKPLKMSSHRF